MQKDADQISKKPLDGIRVLDLATFIATTGMVDVGVYTTLTLLFSRLRIR